LGNRTLYYAVRFVNIYPDVSALPDGLNWSHYKILFSIEDENFRKECEKLLQTGKYSFREFIDLVKKKKGDLVQFVQSGLYHTSGVPFLYSVRQVSGKACLDLGFFTYLDLYHDQLANLPDKTPVLAVKDDSGYSFQQEPDKSKLLYTYKAIVTDVVDGDTLKLTVDLGFNIIRSEVFRLNKIDAPEIDTDIGQKAKNFVIDKLSSVPFVAVKIYHKDKYARYLADIFYPNFCEAKILQAEPQVSVQNFTAADTRKRIESSEKIEESTFVPDLNEILSSGNFLNQELIDNGLAVKYYVD
jgi:micrococcal nuclease